MNYNYKQRSAVATPPQPVQQASVQMQQSQPQMYQAPPPTMPLPVEYDANQNPTYIGGIRKCAVRNKIISFHSKLVLPDENNYPALHAGSSSSKTEDGPQSRIELRLTDSSNEKSKVYVTYNLTVDEFFYWKEIVAQKLVADCNLPELAALLGQMRQVAGLASGNYKDLAQCGKNLKAAASKEPGLEPVLVQMRSAVTQVRRTNNALTRCGKILANMVDRASADTITVFETEKINSHGVQDAEGKSPVYKIAVKYQPVYKGNISNYPWYIQIANGYGVAQKTTTGGTCCQSGTYKETGQAFINLDAKQLYCALRGVCSYIETWETCVAGPMVLNMESRRNNIRR